MTRFYFASLLFVVATTAVAQATCQGESCAANQQEDVTNLMQVKSQVSRHGHVADSGSGDEEEVTEELGATRVVPGSHKMDRIDRFESGADSVPAELGPGDALVYSGYVFHGGGANRTTDRWRRAMHLSFVAGWLTPEESCSRDFTTAELAGYSPRVQRLLGHRSYDPRPHPGGGLWLQDVKGIDA